MVGDTESAGREVGDVTAPVRLHNGAATLHLSDCLQFLRAQADGAFALTIADFPYEVVTRTYKRNTPVLRSLDKGVADVATGEFAVAPVVREAIRVTSGSLYLFVAKEQLSEVWEVCVEAGLTTRLGVWEKTNPSPMNGQHVWLSNVETVVFAKRKGAVFNEHCKGTVWRHAVPRAQVYPAQKPVSLLREFILASSESEATVLDFCMGSGSSGVAAMETGRRFVGVDANPEAIQIAKSRIVGAPFTAARLRPTADEMSYLL